ncbi:MAG TPA: hypothetical protein VIH75_00245 [Candidatus Sulfotelmatobacter sp.]
MSSAPRLVDEFKALVPSRSSGGTLAFQLQRPPWGGLSCTYSNGAEFGLSLK